MTALTTYCVCPGFTLGPEMHRCNALLPGCIC